jgi:hypothetical protein
MPVESVSPCGSLIPGLGCWIMIFGETGEH